MTTSFGTSGNDSWTVVSGGNFTLDGLAGIDTLNLGTYLRSDYSISKQSDGIHVVSILGANVQLHAVLQNMELLVFNNGKDVMDLSMIANNQIQMSGVNVNSTITGDGKAQLLGTPLDDIFIPYGFTHQELTLGPGNDTYNLGNANNYQFSLIPVNFSPISGASINLSSITTSNQNLTIKPFSINDGYGFTDTINFTNPAGKYTLYFWSGPNNDYLINESSNIYWDISPNSGNDTIVSKNNFISVDFFNFNNQTIKIPGISGLINFDTNSSLNYSGVNNWTFWNGSYNVEGSTANEFFTFWNNSNLVNNKNQSIKGGGGGDRFSLATANLTISISDFNKANFLYPQFLDNFGSQTITRDLINASIKITNDNIQKTTINFHSINNTNPSLSGDSSFIVNGLYSSYIINNDNTVSLVPSQATYSLEAIDALVNEGTTAYFSLKTTGLASGSIVPYSISGLDSTQINPSNRNGSVTIDSNGAATIAVQVLADGIRQTKPINLTVSVQDKSVSIPVSDNSSHTIPRGVYITKVIDLYYSAINSNSQNQNNLTFTFDDTPTLLAAWTNANNGQRNKLATLINFNGKYDFIDVGHSYVNGNYSLQPQNFLSGSGLNQALTSTQYIIYDTLSGILYYDPDGNGPVPKEAFASVVNGSNITYSNFQVSMPNTTDSALVSNTLPSNPNAIPIASNSDTYNSSTNQLTITKVSYLGQTFANVVVTVGKVLSVGGIGSVTYSSIDNYDGISLSIPSVTVGTTIYNNVNVTIDRVISINGQLYNPTPVNPPTTSTSSSTISLTGTSPANKSTNVQPTTDVVFKFSESIVPVSGNITLIEPNGKQDFFDVALNPLIKISGNQLTLVHNNFYQDSGNYSISIPSNAIHGISGNNFPGTSLTIGIVGIATLNSNDGGGGGGE